ncbi:MAG TPA: glutamine-hydrolyzing carbamoyl-phosphate synthase small subunit [Clostridia bacterium]|nr:glutamine-hydrolyzing carbamoyl-phosphate synthase small subunit [Clostridia bacterium]
MQGILALEDGTVFTGEAFGATGGAAGEVVFYTGMTGYQRLLTHPNSQNKIIVMTSPLVGNTGIGEKGEARPDRPGCHISGLVVREICHNPAHRKTQKTLPEYLAEQNIIGISGIDTRALTRHLRDCGVMRGLISTEDDAATLVEAIGVAESPGASTLLEQASVALPLTYPGELGRVVIVDLGGGRDFAPLLNHRGFEVVVVPYNASVDDVVNLGPLGVVFSDGAADPRESTGLIATAKGLVEKQTGLFGMGTGCHLLALAMGAKIEKMNFGHRGENYPVKDLRSGKVHITSQNHGFVVDSDSLADTGFDLTHVNVNDGTVEGICHRELALFGMQFETGSFPAVGGADYLLEMFLGKTTPGGR